MKEEEIEIREQVKFRFDQLIENISNQIGIHYAIAFEHMNQKHQHYYEAFKQFKEIAIKEAVLPIPYNNMFEIKIRKIKNIAVERLAHSFLDRETGQVRLERTKSIVFVVEEIIRSLND